MKIKKIIFNSKIIKSNPIQAYDNYAQNVIKILRANSVVDSSSFSAGLHTIGEAFVAQNAKEQMNKKSKWLAETLVSLKQENLAGMIYSFIVKWNYDNPNLRELFATNALAIATRLKDCIHIMARANDLKEIYKLTARGSDKHIKVLYQEKRALSDIINNYENLKAKHQNF